jgi:Glycosyl hydrolase catalytic core
MTLGTRWFIDPGDTSRNLAIPPGAVWVQTVDFHGGNPPPAGLADRVAAHPGSYWLMGSEPNVRMGPSEQTGEQYARSLHDFAAIIKAADQSARLVGPNTVNFDFTCIDCPGYTSGHDWTDSFLAAYARLYGALPPLDIWSLHTYPLDFDAYPQVNAQIVEDQLTGLRAYLDAVPGLTATPIWDTELGTHWGYDGLVWRDDGTGTIKAYPVGSYRTDLVASYLQNLVGWLMQNSSQLGIQRWFLYTSYQADPEGWETVYAGIDLMTGYDGGASLTPLGQVYRQLAGLSP